MAQAVCECDGLDWSAAGCDRAFYVNRARAALAVAAPMVLEMAAEACEDYMRDCLDDKDVQRRWSATHSKNRIYATAIRNLKEQFNGNG